MYNKVKICRNVRNSLVLLVSQFVQWRLCVTLNPATNEKASKAMN